MSDNGYTIYIPVGLIVGIGVFVCKLCCRAGNSNSSHPGAAGTPRFLHMEQPAQPGDTATPSPATTPNSGQNHPPAFYPAPIHDPPPSYDTLKAEENKGFGGDGTEKQPNMAAMPAATTPTTTTAATSDSATVAVVGGVTPQYPMPGDSAAAASGEQNFVDPDASAATGTVSNLPNPSNYSAIVTSEEQQPSYPPPSYDQTIA